MQRRRFLRLTAGGGALLASGPVLGQGALAKPAAAAVVVFGITPTTDAASLIAFAEACVQGGLALTCALAAPDAALDGYGGLVEALTSLGPGVEIALEIPELSALSPYFQGRAVYEALSRLNARLPEESLPPIRTLVTTPTREPRGPEGLRAAGIRNLLVRPRVSEPTRSETWPGGVVRFLGGTHIALLTPRLPAVADGTQRLYYLAARDLAGDDPAPFRRWGTKLADAFFEAELAGEMTSMPVSELQLRDNYDLTRTLAVRLLGEAERLAGALAERDIPSWSEPEAAPGYWIPETGVPVALTAPPCADGFQIEAPDQLSPGVPLHLATKGTPGFDGCAALTLRERAVTAPLGPNTPLLPPAAQDDLVLTIHPEAVADPQATRTLLGALDTLADDGITRFAPLEDLVTGKLSQDPIDQRFRRTRALTAGPQNTPPLSESEKAALLEDAARAWGFFERFTNPLTGLCPATANVYTGEDAITWVTMWDVGSQINALVAAHRLGLIDTEAQARSARAILSQIVGRRSDGRLLPNGVLRTDKPRSGSRDFDGCDAGRLLAALDNLRRHSELEDEIAALVKSWDLDAIILDGEIQSVTSGLLSSTYKSHCAHYAARAFGRWGLTARSPYDTLKGRAEADGRVEMLETIARIGPLGAEPLLLEAMELGMSPESAWLADVLDAAQREEYAETGQLMAVSEMPIRRPPWFVYLGLQLGRKPREWGIDVVGGAAEFRTPEFLAQNMALSTKAAYLWAAYRPGPYAEALLTEVRARAPLPVGFASSVVADGGEVAPFTDLNTNAVILQAIAEMLDPAG